MDNDDTDESSPTTARTQTTTALPQSSNRGAITVAVLMFLLGGVIGLLGGLLLGEDGDDDGAAAPTSEVPIDCAEAEALVDGSVAAMETINESEVQDASFFAALVVEQRNIAFAMEAAPTCFSLEDRGGAQGLLEGLIVLAEASAPLPVQEAPTPDEGE